MDELYAQHSVKGPGTIRVIELQPGKYDDPIQVKIRSVSLDDAELSYEALSYTWGKRKDMELVWISGKIFNATQNLVSALRRLREADRPRTFWIDAMCINQNDVVERAEQVKQMLRIYKQAKTVWLDLGDALPEVHILFNLMFALDKALNAHQNDTITFHSSQFEELGLPPVHDKAWWEWQNLLSRQYFTRLWVIQEFAVSTELYMLLGKTFFPWHNLYTIVSRMQVHGIGEETRPMSIADTKTSLRAVAGKNGLRNMHFIRDRYQANEPLTIPDLLWWARFADSSEPKDKVFGILGLATDIDPNDPDFQIKYDEEETVAELFTRIARGMIRTNRSYVLQLLFEAGCGLAERVEDLPSWIPDWTGKRAGSPLGGLYSAQYHASDGLDLVAEAKGRTISVRGRVVDRVVHATSQFRPDTDGQHSEAYFGLSVVKWLREAFNTVQSIWPKALTVGEDNTVKQQLWQTLICNKTHTDIPAPSDYADQFEALLERQRYVEEALAEVEDESDIVVPKLSAEYSSVETGSILYRQALQNTMYTKKFCITKDRQMMGMVPGETKPGDYVVVVAGSPVPFILRKVNPEEEVNPRWELIQECYIHGVMNGEFVEVENSTSWETFVIV